MCKELEKLTKFYGASIIDYDFPNSIRGAYHDGVIAVNSVITDNRERRCIIAQELGRHIMRNNKSIVLTEEQKDLSARHWAVMHLMPFSAIADAHKRGAVSMSDYADRLGVTEKFIKAGIDFYSRVFAVRVLHNDVIIDFTHGLKCADYEG